MEVVLKHVSWCKGKWFDGEVLTNRWSDSKTLLEIGHETAGKVRQGRSCRVLAACRLWWTVDYFIYEFAKESISWLESTRQQIVAGEVGKA